MNSVSEGINSGCARPRAPWVAAWACGAALIVGASSLSAQLACNTTPCGPTGATNNVTVSVTDVVRLSVSTSTTDLGSPTQADYTAGHKDVAGPTLTVLANHPWNVAIVGIVGGNFTCTPVASCRTTKPAADLLWGTVNGTYGHNAGANTNVFGTSQPATGGTTQSIFYRTNWAMALDRPGTYTLVVSFTLSAP